MLKQYSDMEKQINKQLDKYANVQGLMQYINVNSLYKIHKRQDGEKATGIDKVNKRQYSIDTKEKLRKLIETMKEHKYRPLPVRRVEIPKPKGLIKQLNRKLTGLYNYYGISGNYNWLANVYRFVKRILKKWLSRRSQRGKISWSKLDRIIQYNPLVKPKICFQLW